MLPALPPAPPAAVVTAPAVFGQSQGAYEVRPGDTISGIAARYGVSQGRLIALNGLRADGFIRAGQDLRVPGHASRPAATASRRSTAARGAGARTGSTSARAAVAAAARRHGVDRDLVLAVAWQESRWRQDARSHKGAVGVMQCMPSAGVWMSEKLGRTLDLHDVDDNATCGVLMLKTLLRHTDGEAQALAAYYQGLTSVKTNGAYASTTRYVASIQRHRDLIAAGRSPRG